MENSHQSKFRAWLRRLMKQSSSTRSSMSTAELPPPAYDELGLDLPYDNLLRDTIRQTLDEVSSMITEVETLKDQFTVASAVVSALGKVLNEVAASRSGGRRTNTAKYYSCCGSNLQAIITAISTMATNIPRYDDLAIHIHKVANAISLVARAVANATTPAATNNMLATLTVYVTDKITAVANAVAAAPSVSRALIAAEYGYYTSHVADRIAHQVSASEQQQYELYCIATNNVLNWNKGEIPAGLDLS
ncbi:hypothetical protein B0T17DRAFT_183087 [Bombardia bombarda]|uniref:Uncharacterized protein n=1 Tax=Bombardia bombarda TaxID=252184 RepID=A0AA40C8Q5_9PEZI|nr:hypothetical protein B0T17DRAFT_183087 [Bombardia bombarda]